MDSEQHTKHGLVEAPLPYDSRDFSHDQVYGTLGASQLPGKSFRIYDQVIYTVQSGDTLTKICTSFGFSISQILTSNPSIKNPDKIYVGQSIIIPAITPLVLDQTDLDFCTAFASTTMDYALRGGFKGDPFYRMAQEKKLRGEYLSYGANLRDAANVAVNVGALPISNAPFTHSVNGINPLPTDKPRDFLANWMNYPASLDLIASRNKDTSYFALDGNLDAFDNVRSALSFYTRERRIVNIGVMWRPEWTFAPGGKIVDSGYDAKDNGGEGHSIDLVGQEVEIDGTIYIVNQGSWGLNYGDKGFFYFPRSVINKEISRNLGGFVYTKMPRSKAQWYMDNNIQVGDNWLIQIYKVFETFIINHIKR